MFVAHKLVYWSPSVVSPWLVFPSPHARGASSVWQDPVRAAGLCQSCNGQSFISYLVKQFIYKQPIFIFHKWPSIQIMSGAIIQGTYVFNEMLSSSLLPINRGLAKGCQILPIWSSMIIPFLMSANIWAKLNMVQPTLATLELKLAPARMQTSSLMWC